MAPVLAQQKPASLGPSPSFARPRFGARRWAEAEDSGDPALRAGAEAGVWFQLLLVQGPGVSIFCLFSFSRGVHHVCFFQRGGRVSL